MDHLTPAQKQAVEFREGPLLVLAGPGSGKTRVITHRIEQLVRSGVDPRKILAVTFTNKAAREMQERVQKLLPGTNLWVSTFHRFCAYLLRRNARMIGLEANFSIFSTTDQKSVVKQVLNDLDIDAVHYPPANILSRISRAKNDLITANQYARDFNESYGDHFQAVVARAFPIYQKLLLKSNAVDFDDLLMHVVQMLSENEILRQQLDQRYEYVLVDEYQDTNLAQYQLIRMLAHDCQNICATGDPDQSIYGWRGARIDNILRFEHDYPACTTIRLEQNFRSTKAILNAADQLIINNTQRKQKDLLTNNPTGDDVRLCIYQDEREEADMIAGEIGQIVSATGCNWSDFAIFYRVNALSREMERALTRWRIPFQVAAGVAFYERAEIKDLLAYLRLISNPADYAAFARVVNRPVRGIGKKTQQTLRIWAEQNGWTMMQAVAKADDHPTLSRRAKSALYRFGAIMNEFSLPAAGSVAELLRKVIEKIGYLRDQQFTEAEYEQAANVEELLSVARQYDADNPDDPTLEGFLETTSLASDLDALSDAGGQVTLMTLHAAKGLEFPHVYLLGLEQNLIPHERAMRTGEKNEYEEERRLLFVGITRAEKNLTLTQTRQRGFRGKTMSTIPSDFLSEMSLTIADMITGNLSHSHASSSVVRFEEEDSEPTEDHFKVEASNLSFETEDFDTDDLPDLSEHESNESNEPATGWRSKRKQAKPRKKKNNRVDLPKSIDEAGSHPLLMKGTDLDTPQETADSSTFSVGMQVRHPRYGRGKIVQLTGAGKSATVTVDFTNGEVGKSFRIASCPLQPLGVR